jgi:CelD/BcsL family acetyltransferase involved in cellulose biosynthesis
MTYGTLDPDAALAAPQAPAADAVPAPAPSPAPSAPAQRWRPQPVRLKFLLGEKAVFVKSFPGVTLDAHFMSLPVRTEEQLEVPAAQLHDGCEAAVMRSQPVAAELPRLTVLPDAIRYVPRQYRRYFVDLQKGTFADYLAAFSGKSRSTLRRKVKKLTEECGGQLSMREYATPEEIETFYGLAREVSRKTYQERLLGSGVPDTDAFRAHVRDLAARGDVRGYLLSHGDKPIAFILCPVDNGTLIYEYVGYDPDYKNLSPGTVLQYLVLEKLFGDGSHRAFDFTEGEGQHKEFFSTGNMLCADVYYFRRTVRNLWALRAHSATAAASASAVRALRRLGVDKKIKSWMRSR